MKKMIVWATLICFVCIGIPACIHHEELESHAAVATKYDANTLNALTNKSVRVIGIADNGLSGALIILNDEWPIYIRGMGTWPEDVRNKKIEVTGILRHTVNKPKLTDDEGNPIEQGAFGDRYEVDCTEIERWLSR